MAKNFRIRAGHNLQLRVNSLTGGLVNQVGDVGRAGGPRIFQYALKDRF